MRTLVVIAAFAALGVAYANEAPPTKPPLRIEVSGEARAALAAAERVKPDVGSTAPTTAPTATLASALARSDKAAAPARSVALVETAIASPARLAAPTVVAAAAPAPVAHADVAAPSRRPAETVFAVPNPARAFARFAPPRAAGGAVVRPITTQSAAATPLTVATALKPVSMQAAFASGRADLPRAALPAAFTRTSLGNRWHGAKRQKKPAAP